MKLRQLKKVKLGHIANLRGILNYILFGQTYLANLRFIRTCTYVLLAPFHVYLQEEKVVVRRWQLKWQRKVYNIILAAILMWSGTFLTRVSLRVFGIPSNNRVSSSYTMTQKLLDTGWLTVLTCTLIYKFEFFRKGDEFAALLNSSTFLEKAARARG
jgi:hypothetical protein